ncbi:response regulator [Novosphingobium sp. FSY-8]|uniref:Response regulator n=1 Tax=Novosphingobium ovatum TaxID=1908523 RepID=A0ABW9XFV5_9SPHN|nr:response regulator [Novosphingobium ovatum]NBC37419.1 response regulator [Novosphingobium ovatum]
MKHILIVDDSPTILMSMEGVLSRAGFQVSKAPSGEDAVRALQNGVRPNLVITDLNMRGMNGIDVIKAIRANSATRFTPVLMLTTESAQDKRQEARSAGATGWLVKPVQPNDLLGVVRQVMPGA